ncbi:magnesium transporter CorA [Geobacillus genomosp. 3]|uniref:Magnesium transporter CorA n=1 Tax=Geobacillus genomosp. 3 TaxID=1921421 RepID=S5Z4Q1_GEOG3|nr:CorA family divalent cation transporter [Geobacillus genomosp. 3]AGT31917.1 magnesium transporter CorA [Geobacillus genomosp. 3]
MAINHYPRLSLDETDKRHAPAGGQSCWFHFTAAVKPDLERLLSSLSIHPLAQKRLIDGTDIPLVDEYEGYVFLSLFIIRPSGRTANVRLLAAERHIISYMDEDDPFIGHVKEQLADHRDQALYPGYVLYHFLDLTTARFLQVVDQMADRIQILERQVFATPFANEIGREIYRMKTYLHELRQVAEAQEEAIKTIRHAELPYINAETNPYIDEVASRFARVPAALDTFKESLSAIFDLQLSLKSDHMNVIMKTLTLVSVIFLPMTFIAGVYGMNFAFMPELKWRYGYPLALLLMATVAVLIALYFKRKGWWGETETKEK